MAKRDTWILLLIGAVIAGITFIRSPHLAFSQASNVAITPIAMFRVTPNDNTLRLLDVTADDTGLSFLFGGRSAPSEVVKTDATGNVLSVLSLPDASVQSLVRSSDQGTFAILGNATGSQVVYIYSATGSLITRINPTQEIIDMGFWGTSLLGFGYNSVIPLYPQPNANNTLITTNVYGPFQAVPLPNNSFGIVHLTKGTLTSVDVAAGRVLSSVSMSASFDRSPPPSADIEMGLIGSVSSTNGRLFALLTGSKLTEGVLISEVSLAGTEKQTFRCALLPIDSAPTPQGLFTLPPIFFPRQMVAAKNILYLVDRSRSVVLYYKIPYPL